MSACPACGRRTAAGDTFCAGCGRALAGSGPPAVEIEMDAGAVDGAEVVLARPSPRRWWVGAAVLGLAGIVVASVATGGGPARSEGATTTTPPATTAAPTTTTPSTLPPPTSTASTASPPTSAPIRLGPAPLLGEPSGLALVVGVGEDRYLVDLDAATAGRLALPTDLAELEYTAAGLVGRSPGDNAVRLVRPPTPGPDPLIDASYVGSDARGRAWFTVPVANRPRFRLLYLERGATAAVGVDLPGGGFALPDGTGGLVVDAPGGVYRWTDDAAITRVSAGRMEAAGGGTVVVGECDEALRCRDVAVDVVTGARRELPVVAGLEPASYAYGAVSPDGQVLLGLRGAEGAADAPPAGLVAVTADGTAVELGPHPSCLRPACGGATWSPDGRWLVWAADGSTVAAWRPGLARPVRLTLPEAVTNPFGLGPGVGRPTLSVLVGPADELRALA